MVSSRIMGAMPFLGLQPQANQEVDQFRKHLQASGLGVFAESLNDGQLTMFLSLLTQSGLGSDYSLLSQEALGSLFSRFGISAAPSGQRGTAGSGAGASGLAALGVNMLGRTDAEVLRDVETVGNFLKEMGYEAGNIPDDQMALDSRFTYADINGSGTLDFGDIVTATNGNQQLRVEMGGDGELNGWDDRNASVTTLAATESVQGSNLVEGVEPAELAAAVTYNANNNPDGVPAAAETPSAASGEPAATVAEATEAASDEGAPSTEVAEAPPEKPVEVEAPPEEQAA